MVRLLCLFESIITELLRGCNPLFELILFLKNREKYPKMQKKAFQSAGNVI